MPISFADDAKNDSIFVHHRTNGETTLLRPRSDLAQRLTEPARWHFAVQAIQDSEGFLVLIFFDGGQAVRHPIGLSRFVIKDLFEA